MGLSRRDHFSPFLDGEESVCCGSSGGCVHSHLSSVCRVRFKATRAAQAVRASAYGPTRSVRGKSPHTKVVEVPPRASVRHSYVLAGGTSEETEGITFYCRTFFSNPFRSL